MIMIFKINPESLYAHPSLSSFPTTIGTALSEGHDSLQLTFPYIAGALTVCEAAENK